MIDNLLDAYEGMRKEALWQKIKKLSILEKITLSLTIIEMVLLVVVLVFEEKWTYVCLYVFAGVLWLLVFCVKKKRHEKWIENIEEYDKLLDVIKGLLKEYHLYEKNKIKQLIRKYKVSIEEIENEKSKKRSTWGEFIGTYILPILAFIAGRVGNDYELIEVAAMGIVVVILIICTKMIWSSVLVIADIVNGEPLECRKRFMRKLQDLVDRDFEILDEDLL